MAQIYVGWRASSVRGAVQCGGELADAREAISGVWRAEMTEAWSTPERVATTPREFIRPGDVLGGEWSS